MDDGSSDDTAKIHHSLKLAFPDQVYATTIEHGGKSAAVRHGVLQAFKGNAGYIGYWDADLSTPLYSIESFRKLLARDPSLLFIFGSRVSLLGRNIERSMWRHYPGRVYATVVSIMLNLGIYDTQCGAKLFQANSRVRGLFDKPFVSRWSFDVEIIARMKLQGQADPSIAILEYPLEEWHDVSGSKISLLDMPGILIELVRIYWTYLRPGTDAGKR